MLFIFIHKYYLMTLRTEYQKPQTNFRIFHQVHFCVYVVCVIKGIKVKQDLEHAVCG